MSNARQGRKALAKIHLNPDRSGLLAGAFLGTIVMAWCFYTGEVSFSNVILRTAITFGGAYAAAGLLTTVAQRIYRGEQRAAREAERLRRAQEAAEEEPDMAEE